MKLIKTTIILLISSAAVLSLSGCKISLKTPGSETAPPSATAPVETKPSDSQTPEPTESPATQTPSASSPEPTQTPVELGDDWVLMHASSGKLADDMPEWLFSLYGKIGDEAVVEMALQIDEPDSGRRLYSEVIANEAYFDMHSSHVLLEDANFDGHKDVLFTGGPVGSHGHIYYFLLLWDDTEEVLVPEDSFSEILNPVIDAKDKIIRSYGANSAFEYYYDIYRLENGKFRHDMQIEVTDSDPDDEEAKLVYKEYKIEDGKKQLVNVFEAIAGTESENPELSEYFAPDSLWKLNDPIWFESRHFEGMGE